MILSKEAAEVLRQLQAIGNSKGYPYETRKALSHVVNQLAFASGGDTETDVAKAIVVELLDWADGYTPLAAALVREAINTAGLSQHIPPTEGTFNVEFGGLTVRLTLPLKRDGSVERLAVARVFMDALSGVTLTPVTVEASEPSGDVFGLDADAVNPNAPE